MNVTRSRSISSSAASGSQRAMSTLRKGTTPGSVMPLSRPEMCAHGAGISTQSSAPRWWTSRHERCLVRERRLGVQHAFGRSARSRREQHRRELFAVGPRIGDRGPVGEVVEVGDDELRRDGGDRPLHVVRAEQVVQRCRDRAQPPAGAVQHGHLVTVVRLPRDRVAGLRLPGRGGRPRRARSVRRGRVVLPASAARRATAGPTARRAGGSRPRAETRTSVRAPRRRRPVRRGATSSRRWPVSRPAARSCR